MSVFDTVAESVEHFATGAGAEALHVVEQVGAEAEADLKAFAEHSEVTAKIALGKDKIAALDELHKAGLDALAFLEAEKARTLSDVAALKAKVETLLASL